LNFQAIAEKNAKKLSQASFFVVPCMLSGFEKAFWQLRANSRLCEQKADLKYMQYDIPVG